MWKSNMREAKRNKEEDKIQLSETQFRRGTDICVELPDYVIGVTTGSGI